MSSGRSIGCLPVVVFAQRSGDVSTGKLVPAVARSTKSRRSHALNREPPSSGYLNLSCTFDHGGDEAAHYARGEVHETQASRWVIHAKLRSTTSRRGSISDSRQPQYTPNARPRVLR